MSRLAPWLKNHLRRYVARLSHAGILIGLLFFFCSLTPSLLPRDWLLQGLVSGITFAIGYAAGVLLTALAAWIGVPEPGERFRRRAWIAIWLVVLLTLPVMLWLSSGWQQEIRAAVGMPRGGRVPYLAVFALAAGVVVLLIGIGRAIGDLYRLIVRWLGRVLPRALARSLAVLTVAALLAGLLSGVIYRGFVHVSDHIFSASDRTGAPGRRRRRRSARAARPHRCASARLGSTAATSSSKVPLRRRSRT